MTVEIIHTNGKEAVVIADSRVSGHGRQSDSVVKLKEYQNNNFHSITVGTGVANYLLGIFSDIDSYSKTEDKSIKSNDTSDLFVKFLYQNHRRRINELDNTWLSASREEIRKKASLIDDENERKSFTNQKIGQLMDDLDKSRGTNDTTLLTTLYDNNLQKIRIFSYNFFGKNEDFSNHVEVGSGFDGANVYLASKLQGLDSSKMSLEELMFYSLNAHSMSTINAGVGGTPKIAIISEKNTLILPEYKSITLANLSGAYLSECYNDFQGKKFKSNIGEVLTDSLNYSSIASKIGLTTESLKNIYIPYSSWQESSNRKIFEKK